MADEFGQRIQGLHAVGDTPVATDTHSALLAVDNSGDYQYLTLSATGALLATGGTEYQVDDVAGGTDAGGALLVVRDDALTTLTPADGDYTTLRVNSTGALWVDISDTTVAVTQSTSPWVVSGTVAATQSGSWDIGTVTTLTTITNDVNIADGGNSITVDGTVAATQSGVWDIGTVTTLTGITNDVSIDDGGNSITVDAVNLDIRDLTHVSDSVKIGDGTDFLAIETDGSINVNASIGATDSAYGYGTANLVKDTITTVVTASPGADTLYAGVLVSGAGYCEWIVQFGTTSSEATIMSFWTTPSNPTQYLDLPDYLTVSSGETILVRGTNRENAASPASDFAGHASLINKV